MADKNKLEVEQAFLRIVGLWISGMYLYWVSYYGVLDNEEIVVSLGVVYITLSVLLKVFAELDVFHSPARRYFGIFLDTSMTTAYMLLLSEYGALLYAVYLWVSVGNGFRYGNPYLFVAVVLSIFGFSVVCYYDEFWSNSVFVVIMCYVVMIILPIYMGILLKGITSEKERAERSSREKSRFIANVSHEIRTPLNAIVGFSSMIDKVGAVDQREMVMRIKDASGALMDLVEGVLNFSQIEGGDIKIRLETFSLPLLVSSVEGIFSLQIEKKGLQFRTMLDEALPHFVTADQQRLRQVLINLLGNAVKFTEKGSVELKVTRVPASAGQEMINFEVIDTGPGITGEFQAHIFERFRQEDDSIERRYGGTGLGTSISQHLVEMMGGRIGVQSVFGKGCRFWFTCPLVCAEKADYVARDSDVVPAVRPTELVPGFHARVLVVEDSDTNCHVYRAMFNYLGVETDFAGTGTVALGKLEKEKYDMLVFDMQIPGMSGAETIARYHQLVPLSQRSPVIVITGDATTEIERKCGQLGVQTLLTKPVSIGKISNLVNRYILAKTQECPAQG